MPQSGISPGILKGGALSPPEAPEKPPMDFASTGGFCCIYMKMMNNPTSMPTMAEKAGSLLWYMRIACGRISPKTT